MLVEGRLKVLADKYGRLTPELSVGFKAVLLAEEHFIELEDVAAVGYNSTAAAFAIRNMLGEGSLVVYDHGKHQYVFCHLPTNSVLRMDLEARHLGLPPHCRKVEDAILHGEELPPGRITHYSECVNVLVSRLVSIPPKDLFRVSSFRCKPAQPGKDSLCRFMTCHRCGSETRVNRLFEAEGFLLCPSCAGIESSWFQRKCTKMLRR